MKLYNFLVILFIGTAYGNIVSNVRVVDFADYVIDVISATVKHLEQKKWSSLKVADASVEIDEVVLGWHANGTVHYKNAFVNSIQAMDIRQDTVQSVVNLNSEQNAQATIRGTLRMHDVEIGYDVEAVLGDGTYLSTATFVYPLVNIAFTITKTIDVDDLDVTAVGNAIIPNIRFRPDFRPKSKATDVFTTLFDSNMSVPSINTWGPNVFQPIVKEVITNEVKYPEICYQCTL